MQNRQGFTLIEILVVLLILGIASGVALLAFGDFGASRKVTVAAEQFASYIRLVQQGAILEMNTLGIRVNQRGYQTFRLEAGQNWQPLSESLLGWKSFPQGVQVTLQGGVPKNNAALPDIIIDSSGDMTSFQLHFGNTRQPGIVRLIGQPNGILTLQKDTNS